MTTAQIAIAMHNEYGHIEVRENKIIRTKNNRILYEIPVSEIKVIGEFTTDYGRYLDDWFLVIVTKNDWYEIPMGIFEISQMLEDLGRLLGGELTFQLTKSTNWKTRIMYPENSRDKDLYEIVDATPTSLWDRIKKLIGLGRTVRQFSRETRRLISE